MKQGASLPLSLALILCCAVTSVFLQIRYAKELRGSDQYWYVQDVETLALRGVSTTNVVFPATLNRPDARIPAPFIHNILPVYLTAPFVPALGGYRAWLAANGLGLALTALCAGLAALRLTGSWGATALAVCTLLCLPSTAWLTAQPLAEILTGVPIAMALLTLALGETGAHWLAATFCVGLAYLSRESFLATLLLMPVARMASGGWAARAAKAAVPIALMALAFVPLQRALLPQNIPGCKAALMLAAGSPAADQDACYFPFDPAPFPVVAVAEKFGANLLTQLGAHGGATLIFFLPFDLLALLALTMPRNRGGSAVFWFSAALLLMHLATIEIFQNQYRYSQPILAAVLVCSVLAIQRRAAPAEGVWLTAAAAIAVIALGISAVTLRHGADQAPREAREFQSEIGSVSRVPRSEAVLVSGMDPRVQAAVAPLLAVAMRPGHPDPKVCAALKELKVGWVFAKPEDPLLNTVLHEAAPLPRVGNEPELLYRLADSPCPAQPR